MNYARRQQCRRLSRAGSTAAGAAAVAMLGLWLASMGATSIGGVLVVLAIVLGLHARHWLVLAGRSGVGARSEDEVHRALAPLGGEDWRLRHSLPLGGRGDIDSVAITPTGVAFAIETKTRTFDASHVVRVREMAQWLHRCRRRWCRRGAFPVVCVVRAEGLEYVGGGVLIVSLDRLVPALRVAAGLATRPALLAGAPVSHL
ncbi:MAG: nuclease-related domain-containing protein [Solirubrobacteraceae bacterium]